MQSRLLQVVGLVLGSAAMVSAAGRAETVTEIEVIGQRPIVELRRAVEEAETAVHDLWNSVNDEPLFEIRCVREARTGTTLKRRTCAPRFVVEATAKQARGLMDSLYMGGTGGPLSPTNPNEMIQSLTPHYQQKMQEAVRQHPALLEAVIRHQELQEQLAERLGPAERDD